MVKLDDGVWLCRRREVLSTNFPVQITSGFTWNEFTADWSSETSKQLIITRNNNTGDHQLSSRCRGSWKIYSFAFIFFSTQDPLTQVFVYFERDRELQTDDPRCYLFTCIENTSRGDCRCGTLMAGVWSDNRCRATVHVLPVTDNSSLDTCVRRSF
jgi:hypothetical protein